MNSCVHSEEAYRKKQRPSYIKKDEEEVKRISIQGAQNKELSWMNIQRAPMISKRKVPFWEIKENKNPPKTIFVTDKGCEQDLKPPDEII